MDRVYNLNARHRTGPYLDLHLGPRFDGASNNLVRIVNVEMDRDWRTADSSGPLKLYSGNSSANITVVPPKSSSACPMRPLGSVSRNFSRAPNALE